ncbi:hypothetical protein MNBD_UNCLBAC01-1056 [hydrothermal vent metagenome]|uniref:Uncharacterized protein n=1 Tax=hydrothermal vent metagenome TaxID=652676 RepID=A0A3B1D163_9ZZZZ
MGVINVKKFGFAVGFTGAILYLGCVFVMAFAGKEASIFLFNSLMHGIDVSSIIKMNVPIGNMILGIFQTFILGTLVGSTIASIYNFQLGAKK